MARFTCFKRLNHCIMKKTTIGGLLFATLILNACGASDQGNDITQNQRSFTALENAAWLMGRWQNNSNEGNATETWQKENDSTYTASSYFVVGKDTVSSESIKLIQTGPDVFYIPTVKNQNNGQPVKFKLTSGGTDLLVFENPEHDFPQKISYAKISEIALEAEISGIRNGKQSAQKFPMTRVK